jgi:hypothetical protein
MGFYLRKSLRVGPFRFNFSGSGIGVSAGIRGLRVGTGLRGHYVHMGVGGLYYRATLPALSSRSKERSAASVPKPQRQPVPREPRIPSGTHDPLTEIESSDVSKMVDSSSKELLDELHRKQRAVRWGPIALTLAVVGISATAYAAWPNWALIVTAILAAAVVIWAYLYDTLNKSIVLFYEFDHTMEGAYGALHAAAQRMAGCAGVWHIAAAGAVRDRKYHAGASQLVNRASTRIGPAPPPFVKTNIATIALKVGRQTLHFFPERVLVYDGSGVGAVSYADLRIAASQTRFIEDGGAPSDATVVGHTWRYVNKGGGPDRRFKDNRQLSVCLYDVALFSSGSGLNELVQFSKTGVATAFANAVATLARVMPKEGIGPPPTTIPAPTAARLPMTPERKAELVSRARAIAAARRGNEVAGEHRLDLD